MKTMDMSQYWSSIEGIHKNQYCGGHYLKREREKERDVTKTVLQKRFYQGIDIPLPMAKFLILPFCSQLILFPVTFFLNVVYVCECLH